MVDKNETRRNTEYESIEKLFFDGQTYCIIRNKQPLDSTNAMMQGLQNITWVYTGIRNEFWLVYCTTPPAVSSHIFCENNKFLPYVDINCSIVVYVLTDESSTNNVDFGHFLVVLCFALQLVFLVRTTMDW